ncbi:hypothetical protein F751_2354 [Auxenochlorella protothecoides]|uniref:Uncharacterized protein n=1 Tax=Auxenochlorella protothecoides TaxID=3075 RepID=A0A087SFY2_AUXPR|nr:hypothetical protein F751_2354 [Auxenochlorella protothecoides]KFM24636.1 hypothetical protein F751_2354 [Auxenochlorella protothecoides]
MDTFLARFVPLPGAANLQSWEQMASASFFAGRWGCLGSLYFESPLPCRCPCKCRLRPRAPALPGALSVERA